MRKRPVVLALLALLVLLPALAGAQGLRDRLQHAREASRQERPVAVPAGGTAIRNVAYGPDPAQRFDVYLPARAANAPVVFYVHGGGWANGDKTNPGLADKLAHWLPKGYAVVSSNYRMLPEAMPQEQARDIARAVASVQRRAGEWQLDRARIVLMGHSAGAHLVALLGADPRMLAQAGATPPRGIVSLDSGALDVPALMGKRRVPKLYQEAFGAEAETILERADVEIDSRYGRWDPSDPSLILAPLAPTPSAKAAAEALSADDLAGLQGQ